MITSELKDFIERNIELLNDDLRNFLGKALFRLRGTVFEELVTMLKEAYIPFEEHRTQMLINKLSFVFPVVDDNTPLTDVMKDHLFSRGATTFFGLSLSDLVDFVCAYQDRWKDDMHLAKSNGIIRVRTNYDN